MSLSIAGVWAVGVWDQTTWADGVWREGAANAVAGGKHNAAGFFPTGQADVVVTLYDPLVASATPVSLTSNVCVEVGGTGLYLWDMTKITTTPQPYKEYGYVMTDGATKVGGIIAYDSFFSQYLVHSNMI